MDISQFLLFRISEGTESSPFVLTEQEVQTLYNMATSGNEAIELSGVVTTTSGFIADYIKFQLGKTFPLLKVLAQEEATAAWTLQFRSSRIFEGGSTTLISGNMPIEALDYEIQSVSVQVSNGNYSQADVINHLHIDTSTGVVSYDAPDSNAGWIATIGIKFFPQYNADEYKVLTLNVRAIAITDVTVSMPSKINMNSECQVTASAYPENNTKSSGIVYGFSAVKGIITPEKTSTGIATYYAPNEETSEENIFVSWYLFGSSTSSGYKSVPVIVSFVRLTATADKTTLNEGESATITMGDYSWGETKQRVVVNSASGITSENLLKRISVGTTSGTFSFAAASDNSTFSGTVTLQIIPFNEEFDSYTQMVEIPITLSAVGISDVTSSVDSVGVNFRSEVKLSYTPENHTKGIVTLSLTSNNENTKVEDVGNNTFYVTSNVLGNEDFTLQAKSGNIILVSKEMSFSVQPLMFDLTPDVTRIPEGGKVTVGVTTLNLSNLKNKIEVQVLNTTGEDITEETVLSKVHINDDNTITFDNPQSNTEWEAFVSIMFVAKYADWDYAPCMRNVSFNVYGKAVTGVKIINPKEDTDFAHVNEDMTIYVRPIPYDNTKAVGTTYSSVRTSANSVIFPSSEVGEYTWRPYNPTKYEISADIIVFGERFSDVYSIFAYNNADEASRKIVLEESSNPKWKVEGDEDIIDMILNKYGTYVLDPVHGLYSRLDPDNHSQFVDGTPWDGSYGDAFRHFPKVYYKVEVNDLGKQVLYVSPYPISDKFFEETWIGTYKGYVVNGELHSRPGYNSTNGMTMTAFWNAAQKVGNNYGLVNYFDYQLYNALHLAKFGCANSDLTMGTGIISGNTYNLTTGATAALGDGTGSMPHPQGGKQCKLFGIEGLAGQAWEFRPNIRFEGVNCIVYKGNQVSNTIAKGDADYVRTFQRDAAMNLNSSYVTKMRLGDYFDLIAVTGGGSSTTYWCDGSWSSSGGQLLLVGGSSDHGSICGLAATDSDNGFSFSYATIGARLAFKGDITKYTETSGAAIAAAQNG